jgi:RNA polymerase sigma factor (sigma-70 family)
MAQSHQDQRYIEALLNHDDRVLEELYQKYAGRIKQMILRNNGNESDAADLFQEALMALYQKARTGTFVLTCPIDAYLYLVCKNRWISVLNKRQRNKVTFTDTEGYDWGEEAFVVMEQVKLHSDRRQILETKFAELGAGCKELLRLSWSGKRMDEVAVLLNNSYAYVRKKKSECLAKLISLVKNSSEFADLKW